MEIQIDRLRENGKATGGELYIEEEFECYTLEDEHRDVKVAGETRIPAGTYRIKLRGSGGSINPKYAARYPNHKGMLWLQDVPGFTWIYIHTGNTEEHTDGCILVGDTIRPGDLTIGQSRAAYERLYDKLVDAAARDDLTIEIRDMVEPYKDDTATV